MKGKALPSYIHRRKRDGVLLFRKRYGGRITEIRMETQFPEGEPIPFELHQERERLLTQPAPVKGGNDIAAVIRHYRASDSYRTLAQRTRSDYDKHLDRFTDRMGHIEPRAIEMHHVIGWRGKWATESTPHTANYRVRVLSIVFEHAREMGLLKKHEMNPAKGIKALKYEKTERQQWPDDLIAKFRETYPYATRERLCFELLIGTGQRIGDVLGMRWSDIKDDGIQLRQNKTGKALWVPITDHLRACLEATGKTSLFILSKDMSKTARPGPWAYRSAAQAMRKARAAIGASGYDLHALRYSACVELFLAGCDDETIGAITGQTPAMVQHYTRFVRQKVLALRARDKRR